MFTEHASLDKNVEKHSGASRPDSNSPERPASRSSTKKAEKEKAGQDKETASRTSQALSPTLHGVRWPT